MTTSFSGKPCFKYLNSVFFFMFMLFVQFADDLFGWNLKDLSGKLDSN